MTIYAELNELFNEVFIENFTINEKIVSKKALRRKRRAAKKAAQKQVSKNQETTNKQTNKSQQLIINPKNLPAIVPEQENYSNAFIELRDLLDQMTQKYWPQVQKAAEMWKQMGKNQEVTQEVLNAFIEIRDGLHKDLDNFVTNVYPQRMNELAEQEVNNLEEDIKIKQGFLQKFNEGILALNPKAIEQKTGTDIIPAQSTALTKTTGTALTTLDKEEPEKQTKTKLDDEKRRRKNIITFDDWYKMQKKTLDLFSVMDKIGKMLKNLSFPDFIKRSGKFVTDNIWAFIDSRLAKDTIKTFMYSNPITAMIFDGDFGKLTFAAFKRPPKEKSAHGIKKDKYGLPNNVDNASTRSIKNEFSGNLKFINLINHMYNHVDVDEKDKAQLKKLSTDMVKMVTDKNVTRDRLVSTYTQLIKLVNKIILYLGWDEKTLLTLFKKWAGNKGNTEKEEERIKKRIKDNDFSANRQKSLNDMNAKELENTKELNNMSKEQLQALSRNIQAQLNKQESYNVTNKLLQLLEQAEA